MYGSGPTHAHNTQYAYMGFIYLNSHLCCSENKQRQFTIQVSILPIASKRWVTYYP